jgi:hypothetical protein
MVITGGGPYRIGILVKIQSHVDEDQQTPMKDRIGHVAILLESPSERERRTIGFYPEQPPGDFLLDKGLFWRVTGSGLPGALLDDSEVFGDPRHHVKTCLYPISQNQYRAAVSFVERFRARVDCGAIRYSAFSQCANFALLTLRAAGVRPPTRIPYPPLLHWLMP